MVTVTTMNGEILYRGEQQADAFQKLRDLNAPFGRVAWVFRDAELPDEVLLDLPPEAQVTLLNRSTYRLEILNHVSMQYRTLELLLETCCPAVLHYQHQTAAHFHDAPKGCLVDLLQNHHQLRVIDLHCAAQLSWEQIARLIQHHPHLELRLAWAVVNERQICEDEVVPDFVKRLALLNNVTIVTHPREVPSRPLLGYDRAIRISDVDMDQVYHHWTWRDAVVRTPCGAPVFCSPYVNPMVRTKLEEVFPIPLRELHPG
jgi:hypothetical protein